MTDTAAAPTPEQIAAARALVAQADAADAAAAQAKADAARAAVVTLVASATFKTALTAMEKTLEAAPKNTELGYAVNMMERLAASFAS